MLVSTVRGFFRRIFRVEDLAPELIEDHGFIGPGRLVNVTAEIGPTSDSVEVPFPSTIADMPSDEILIFVLPRGSLGSASYFFVTPAGPGAVNLNLDANPGVEVFFNVTFIAKK